MDVRVFESFLLNSEGTTHFSYTRSNFCGRWSLSHVTLHIKMPRETGRISGYSLQRKDGGPETVILLQAHLCY